MQHHCVQLTPALAAAAAAAAAGTAAVISDGNLTNPSLLEALQTYPVVNVSRGVASQQEGKKGAIDEGASSAATAVLRAAAAAAAQQKQQAPVVCVAECWVDRQGLYVVVQSKPAVGTAANVPLSDASDFIPGGRYAAVRCHLSDLLLTIWMLASYASCVG
jgi:hypothetical protein